MREMDRGWEDHVERVRADVDEINVTRNVVECLNVVDMAVGVLLP